MECQSCGATLRPGARFCNRCGASQPEHPEQPEHIVPAATLDPGAEQVLDDPEAPPPEAELADTAAAPAAPTDDQGEADTDAPSSASSGRRTRPPRVPRMRDAADEGEDAGDEAVEDQERQQAASATGDDEATPDASVADALPAQDHKGHIPALMVPDAAPERDAETNTATVAATDAYASAAASEQEQSSVAASAPEPPMPAGAQPRVATTAAASSSELLDANEAQQALAASRVDFVEAETAEYATLAAAGLVPVLTAVQPGEVAAASADLPWPLPLSMIVGGRYRIEALVRTEPAGPEAQNVYRVTDLQGYERCWSCHTEYGVTAASDRYCRECGADMLSREYLLYEREQSMPVTDTDEKLAEVELAPAAPPDDSDGAEHPGRDVQPITDEVSETGEERSFSQRGRTYRVTPCDAEAPRFPAGARILIAAATDGGRERAGERNEDSHGSFVLQLTFDSHAQPLGFGVVADGLGGHDNGQDASLLVVRTLVEHILRGAALPLASLPAGGNAAEAGLQRVLEEGIHRANTSLFQANQETGEDMGSTVVAALLFGETAYIANAGDSRAYAYENGELRRLTTDHSLVEQLIAGGMIAPEERYTHPQRNQIFRSIGNDEQVEVDLFVQRLTPGMRLLLCSDGLWEMVRDDELGRILGSTTHPREACEQLVAAANLHGGEDNITALVIEVAA